MRREPRRVTGYNCLRRLLCFDTIGIGKCDRGTVRPKECHTCAADTTESTRDKYDPSGQARTNIQQWGMHILAPSPIRCISIRISPYIGRREWRHMSQHLPTHMYQSIILDEAATSPAKTHQSVVRLSPRHA